MSWNIWVCWVVTSSTPFHMQRTEWHAKRKLRLEIMGFWSEFHSTICNYLCDTSTFAESSTITVSFTGPGRLQEMDSEVGRVLCTNICQGVREAGTGKSDSNKMEADPRAFLELGWPLGAELRRKAKSLNPRRLSSGDRCNLGHWREVPGEGLSCELLAPHIPAAAGMSFSVLGRSLKGALGSTVVMDLNSGHVALTTASWFLPLPLNDYYYFHFAEEAIDSQS